MIKKNRLFNLTIVNMPVREVYYTYTALPKVFVPHKYSVSFSAIYRISNYSRYVI